MGMLYTGTGRFRRALCPASVTLSVVVVVIVLLKNTLQKLFTWQNSSVLGPVRWTVRHRVTTGAGRLATGGSGLGPLGVGWPPSAVFGCDGN